MSRFLDSSFFSLLSYFELIFGALPCSDLWPENFCCLSLLYSFLACLVNPSFAKKDKWEHEKWTFGKKQSREKKKFKEKRMKKEKEEKKQKEKLYVYGS